MYNKPLVSIITVCYNSGKTIEDTIKSVMNQTYENIEYIVIDGLSEDNTLDIVNKYSKLSNREFRIISEKDRGLYDAMNKGIKMAKGDIVAIINSDDFYIDNNVINDIVNEFNKEKVDVVYGDLVFVDEKDTDKVVRTWIAKSGEFKKGWNPPHPTTFIKKEVYEKYGYFNINLRIAADYDILYRFLEKYKCSASYINRKLVKMRIGGESTGSIKNIIKGNKEVINSLKNNGAKGSFLIAITRLVKKINQFN